MKYWMVILLLIAVLSITIFYILYFPSTGEGEKIGELGKLKPVSWIKITVLIDNNEWNGLRSPWGISIYIETPSSRILFDAGPDPNALESNSKTLGIDLSKIDFIVISHEHGDHVNGLQYVAKVRKNINVYVPAHMNILTKNWIRSLGFNVIDVYNTTILSKGVVIIGELYGPPYEQGLAIYVENRGLIIFSGCSHPGIDKISEKIFKATNISPFLVMGGFHLAGSPESKVRKVITNLLSLNTKYIAPIHCSGSLIRNILEKEYSQTFIKLHVGSKIYLDKNVVEVKN